MSATAAIEFAGNYSLALIDPLAHMPLDYEPDVDLFAGGGGASTGFEMALGKSPDIAINHDAEALAMHKANHPDSIHFCQNVINVRPLEATGGRLVRALWASPDCTHFSKAKGGKPRNQFIRDLAWIVIRWARDARPKLIGVENVEEFKTWGPLDPEGQPIKEKAGQTFRAWVRQLRGLGYSVSFRELRACDYGAPTTRKRLFIIARLDGKRARWPKPTYGPGTDRPWRTAAECINWEDQAPSIFERKKPLAENTQRRIAEGIRRYVLNAANPFLITYYGPKRPGDFRGAGLDEPLRTQSTENRFGLVSPFFATPAHSTSTGRGPGVFDPETPLRTVTSTNTHAVVAPYLVKPNHTAEYYQCFRGQSVEEPLGAITQSPGFAVCSPYLVTPNHAGDNFRGQGVDEPVGTMTGKGSFCLTSACLVTNTSGHAPSSLDAPVPTLTSGGQQALTTANLIVKNYGGVVGHEVDKPLGTVTAVDHHSLVSACLVGQGGPAYGGKPVPLDKPIGTILAENHKALATANLVKLRGTNIGGPVDAPLQTISAQGQHHGVVSASLIKYYGEGGQHAGVDEPMHTVTSRARFGLQAVHLQQYNGCSEAQPMDEPLPTVPTKDRFGLAAANLCQFNGSSIGKEVSAPLPTTCSRDKFGLVGSSLGEGAGHYEKVRDFLRHWGVIGPDDEAEVVIDGVRLRIDDIGLRMLRPRELFTANGFPLSYKINPIHNGKPLSITSQVKKCGNSVPPPFVDENFRANIDALDWQRDPLRGLVLPLFNVSEHAAAGAAD